MDKDITNDRVPIGPIPKDGVSGKTFKIIKAGISATPLLGGTVAELFDFVVSPHLSKRKDGWLESIAKALNELSQKVDSFDISKLSENDVFISVLLEASSMAIKTHQAEKHEMLTNAVCNSVCSTKLEYEQIKHFIAMIDGLSLEHILILKYLNCPLSARNDDALINFPQWFFYERDGIYYTKSSADGIFKVYFPDTKLPYHYRVKILRDLANNGLINGFINKLTLSEADFSTHRIQANVYNTDGEDCFEYFVTPTGKEFLGYIQNDLMKNE